MFLHLALKFYFEWAMLINSTGRDFSEESLWISAHIQSEYSILFDSCQIIMSMLQTHDCEDGINLIQIKTEKIVKICALI